MTTSLVTTFCGPIRPCQCDVCLQLNLQALDLIEATTALTADWDWARFDWRVESFLNLVEHRTNMIIGDWDWREAWLDYWAFSSNAGARRTAFYWPLPVEW